MLTDDILPYPAWRMRFVPSEAERRRIWLRDSIAWVLVALIHLVIFLILVVSLQQARDRQGRRTPIESILDLSLLKQNKATPLDVTKPEDNERDDVSAKPLTIMPPKPPIIEQERPESAPPGDVLNSIGQALACGANSFEYLTPQQQARCLRQPWHGVIMPNGTIVLDAPNHSAVPGPLDMTGADSLRHQAQTAPNCPMMLNTPCLADMFNGVDPH